MKIRRDNVEYGIYDENNLTGGIVIKRINDTAFGTWTSGASYPVGAKVKVNGTYYICKEGHNAGSTFDPSKWNVYPSAETKITGASVEIEASDWAQWGVYTGDTLTGGIIAQKVNSAADAKINFSQLNTNVTDYTAMGLFDNGTLTGGILVQKLNDGSTTTKISGDKIDITAQQVRVGSTSNVDAWMSTTDTTLTTYYGLITDRATIYQLNTQTARIDNLEATAITADTLSSEIASLRSVNVQSITSNRGGASFYSLNVSSVPTFGGVDCNVPRAINGITLTPNADNTYTLTASDFAGNTINIGTFERGAGGPPSSGRLSYLSAPYTYRIQVQIGEGASAQWKEIPINVYAPDAYDNGWSGAYGTVEAYRVYEGTPGSTIDLDYGQNAMIAARANETSGAQSKTTVDIIKVTAPADRYVDGQTAAGLTYDESAHTVSRALTSTTKSYTINMSESGWVSGTNTVSAKIGTTAINSKEVSLPTVTSTEWVNTTGRTWRADVTLGGGTVSSGTKDFSGYYTDGQTAAGLTYDASAHTVSRALTSTTKSYTINMGETGWVSGKNTVSAKIGTTAINSKEVSLPAVSSTSWVNTTGRTWRADVTLGGGTVSSGTKDFGGYYTDGQTAAGLAIDTTNKKVTRALSSTTKELSITATATITYDSSTHKYTAGAQSKAGNTNMGSHSVASGTEAYDAGWSGAVGTVGAAQVSSGTAGSTVSLGFGGSVLIAAQVKNTSSAASKTNKGIIKVTAPSANTVSSAKVASSGGYSATWTTTVTLSNGTSQTVSLADTYTPLYAIYKQGWNACIDACVKHENAIYGYDTTTRTTYTGTKGQVQIQGVSGKTWVISPYQTFSDVASYKNGTIATLYEIPAKK